MAVVDMWWFVGFLVCCFGWVCSCCCGLCCVCVVGWVGVFGCVGLFGGGVGVRWGGFGEGAVVRLL
ncbi:hypothetical protein RA276_27575, partial [Pseudomonas syringae pv. tagetis]|uniref:hypothetical protein n=1 Tax=Pseudomonas syringae group genomosp. 7 TaxID=251699 RepID=UPI00376F5D11